MRGYLTEIERERKRESLKCSRESLYFTWRHLPPHIELSTAPAADHSISPPRRLSRQVSPPKPTPKGGASRNAAGIDGCWGEVIDATGGAENAQWRFLPSGRAGVQAAARDWQRCERRRVQGGLPAAELRRGGHQGHRLGAVARQPRQRSPGVEGHGPPLSSERPHRPLLLHRREPPMGGDAVYGRGLSPLHHLLLLPQRPSRAVYLRRPSGNPSGAAAITHNYDEIRAICEKFYCLSV